VQIVGSLRLALVLGLSWLKIGDWREEPLMDDGCNSPACQARLTRVEEQLAELQAEVAELKRILSRSGYKQGDNSSDDTLCAEVADSGPAAVSDGLAVSPAYAQVRLTIFVADTSQHDRHSAQDSPLGDPVSEVARAQVSPVVLVQAPDELRSWVVARPEPLRERIESLLEGVQERLSQRAAEWLVDAVWEPATVDWHVTDFGGFDGLSASFEAADSWGHREIGDFTEQLGLVGLPAAAVDGAGVAIRYLVPLPGDQSLEDLSRLIRVVGTVAFTLAGGHVLACMSAKSLVHDKMVDLVAMGIKRVIHPGHDESRPTPERVDDFKAALAPESEIKGGESPEATGPDAAPAAKRLRFIDTKPEPIGSAMAREASSRTDSDCLYPGSNISPALHRPDDEYPDVTLEIKIQP
jgi:hypothetical protein